MRLNLPCSCASDCKVFELQLRYPEKKQKEKDDVTNPNPVTIKDELSEFKLYHEDFCKVIQELQSLYVNDQENLNAFIDEEAEIKLHYKILSKNVKDFLSKHDFTSKLENVKLLQPTNSHKVTTDKVRSTQYHTPVDINWEITNATRFVERKPQNQKPNLYETNPFLADLRNDTKPKQKPLPLPQEQKLYPNETNPFLDESRNYTNPNQKLLPPPAVCLEEQTEPQCKKTITVKEIDPKAPISTPLGINKPSTDQHIESKPTPASHMPKYPAQYAMVPYSIEMHLKPIEINPSKGSYVHCETYRDTYEAQIHNPMSSIEKLRRLKSFVVPATKFISNLQPPDINYIKLDYENPRRLLTSHLQALFDLKPSKNQNAPENKNTVDAFENQFRAIDSLNEVENPQTDQNMCHVNTFQSLEEHILKIGEIVFYPQSNTIRNSTDLECKEYMSKPYKRKHERFTVKLPSKNNPELQYDNNGRITDTCCLANESKFATDDRIQPLYFEFMKKYLKISHREETKTEVISYYIPHQVFKSGSVEEESRVAFNASSKNSENVSLNDLILTGPSIQNQLISITIHFRTHNIVLIGDIEKMYRQIFIDATQQKYQGITSKQLKTYKLKTLTYGTVPATFLATRCLKEVVKLYKDKYPSASPLAERDFYMDDSLPGALTTKEAILWRNQVQKMLIQNGFPMSKWLCNDTKEIISIPEVLRATTDDLNFDLDETVKTLEMYWNLACDEFTFKTTNSSKTSTKRFNLSDIAKIFDLLELIVPWFQL
uniref:CSON013235 protein n=1 Tax=Culicoides sonorensis TaxID=179676 RepID=A0A336LMN1_CULSO